MSAYAPPQALSRPVLARRTVEHMGDTGGQRECVGRDDDTQCRREGETEVAPGHWVCDQCHDHAGLDHLVPSRRPVEDDGLTRPVGDPGEAGHGTAA